MGVSSHSVRVGDAEHSVLADLAKEEGRSMQAILAEALDQYRRKKFWEKTNSAYQALRDDPKAWQDELDERALWESTLPDGLETE